MKDDDWSDWEVVRRQVAVCGRMSPALVDKVVVRAIGQQSVATATVRHDGVYFCLDLPSGDHDVTATDGRGELFGGGTARVSRNADGDVTYAVVDITSSSSAPAQRLARRRRS